MARNYLSGSIKKALAIIISNKQKKRSKKYELGNFILSTDRAEHHLNWKYPSS